MPQMHLWSAWSPLMLMLTSVLYTLTPLILITVLTVGCRGNKKNKRKREKASTKRRAKTPGTLSADKRTLSVDKKKTKSKSSIGRNARSTTKSKEIAPTPLTPTATNREKEDEITPPERGWENTDQQVMETQNTHDQRTSAQDGGEKKETPEPREGKLEKERRVGSGKLCGTQQSSHSSPDEQKPTAKTPGEQDGSKNRGKQKKKRDVENETQPEQAPMNEKEKRIAKGAKRRETDYPTMGDVLSDWGEEPKKDFSKPDSQEEKVPTPGKKKDEKKKEKGKDNESADSPDDKDKERSTQNGEEGTSKRRPNKGPKPTPDKEDDKEKKARTTRLPNKKKESIDKGNVRNSTDYPTMGDVKSDWKTTEIEKEKGTENKEQKAKTGGTKTRSTEAKECTVGGNENELNGGYDNLDEEEKVEQNNA